MEEKNAKIFVKGFVLGSIITTPIVAYIAYKFFKPFMLNDDTIIEEEELNDKQ